MERQELAAEPASTGGALLRLAEAANAYVEASLVLTEEYLLENAVPAGSGVVQLRRRKLLQTLVARAEEASRVAAAKAQQALGQVPPKAQLFHGAGSELVRGDVDELLRALRYFWRSMMASELSAAVLRPEAVPRLSRR